MSDQLLIQNSKTMQEILKATQGEAEQSLSIATETRHLTEEMTKILHATQQETEASRQLAAQSQRLTEEMMKDSVAMKTVSPFPSPHQFVVPRPSDAYSRCRLTAGCPPDGPLSSRNILCGKLTTTMKLSGDRSTNRNIGHT